MQPTVFLWHFQNRAGWSENADFIKAQHYLTKPPLICIIFTYMYGLRENGGVFCSCWEECQWFPPLFYLPAEIWIPWLKSGPVWCKQSPACKHKLAQDFSFDGNQVQFLFSVTNRQTFHNTNSKQPDPILKRKIPSYFCS